MAEAQQLARVGLWLWDVGSDTVQLSDELYRICGVDPLDFDGTLAAYLRRRCTPTTASTCMTGLRDGGADRARSTAASTASSAARARCSGSRHAATPSSATAAAPSPCAASARTSPSGGWPRSG